MRKNADALSAAGHHVHVLYAFGANWAEESDRHVFDHAMWSHHRVGGHPKEASFTYVSARDPASLLARCFVAVVGLGSCGVWHMARSMEATNWVWHISTQPSLASTVVATELI